jgi:hypothetical protein
MIKKLDFPKIKKGTGPADPPARPTPLRVARDDLPRALAAAVRTGPRSEEQRQWENFGERFLTAGGPSDEAEPTVMLTTPNRT